MNGISIRAVMKSALPMCRLRRPPALHFRTLRRTLRVRSESFRLLGDTSAQCQHDPEEQLVGANHKQARSCG